MSNVPISYEAALDEASQRLETAIATVSKRIDGLHIQVRDAQQGVIASRESDVDRSRLAASLDEARAREQELTQAVTDAGAVLDSAMADIRSLLETKDGDA